MTLTATTPQAGLGGIAQIFLKQHHQFISTGATVHSVNLISPLPALTFENLSGEYFVPGNNLAKDAPSPWPSILDSWRVHTTHRCIALFSGQHMIMSESGVGFNCVASTNTCVCVCARSCLLLSSSLGASKMSGSL